MKEFELIKHFFTEQTVKRKDVLLGIGDDCAVITSTQKQNIVVTTDTLVAGVHFPLSTPARAIGHKAVAVNLSDIAAMGAKPSWLSLAITLPEVDSVWPSEFCAGVFDLCEYYNVELIGGDTTQGPLSITITAQGLTPENKYLSRSGAKAGDWLYVTGEIGDAALALQQINQDVSLKPDLIDPIRSKLDYPKPRVLAGQTLREYASAAIDISDGLSSEIMHICSQSKVGCKVYEDKLPLDPQVISTCEEFELDSTMIALSGGEDYELLFTVPISDFDKIKGNPNFSIIGHITENSQGLNLVTRANQEIELKAQGWNAMKDS